MIALVTVLASAFLHRSAYGQSWHRFWLGLFCVAIWTAGFVWNAYLESGAARTPTLSVGAAVLLLLVIVAAQLPTSVGRSHAYGFVAICGIALLGVTTYLGKRIDTDDSFASSHRPSSNR
jgi:drug/metabolite transporter (DMT)-like permease